MKITDIRLGMLNVPLKTPFKTAMRTVREIEDVVVMVETDTGNIGYGSAPATAVLTGDTHGSIIEAISKLMSPALLGRDIGDLNSLIDTVQNSIVRNFSAKAAMEIAIYDLYGHVVYSEQRNAVAGEDNQFVWCEISRVSGRAAIVARRSRLTMDSCLITDIDGGRRMFVFQEIDLSSVEPDAVAAVVLAFDDEMPVAQERVCERSRGVVEVER